MGSNLVMKLHLKLIPLLVSISLGMSIANSNPIRIMPLGDSITYDSKYGDERLSSMRSGYRNHLWYALQDANISVNFVGSVSAGQAIAPPFDYHNEGHPGWTSHEVAEGILRYLNLARPDTILLHIGTNDNSSSTRGVESILNEIDQYERNSEQKVLVLIALIIDRQSPDPIITAFNKNLSELVSLRRKTGDRITLVPMQKDAALHSSDYIDNTHPNDSGYKKIAKVWFNAIKIPYKPYNVQLAAFPYTLVSPSYISSLSLNEENNSVTFITKIPDDGIKF